MQLKLINGRNLKKIASNNQSNIILRCQACVEHVQVAFDGGWTIKTEIEMAW